MDKRINIFCGNYGSGKTEISINYTIALKKRFENIAIIDLDIVNPYFRSREASEILRRQGINVIYPEGKLAFADLPAVSPEILGKLNMPDYRLVFDVGGDDAGAVALGGYFSKINSEPYELFFVVNPYRPFTRDIEGVKEIMDEVQRASRLQITSIISNPNFGQNTSVREVLEGHQKVLEFARETGQRVAFLAVMESLIPEIDGKVKEEIFPVKRFMKTPWEKD